MLTSKMCMATGAGEVDSLYDLIAEFMRPLPCHAFTSLVGHIRLPPESYKRLLVFVVLPYMTNPPKRMNLHTINQTLLVEEFLPYNANSTSPVDNAKLSLVLERLLQQLLREGRLSSDDDILMQINKGVAARNKRTKIDARRTYTADALDAKDELRLSGERLLLSVRMLSGGSLIDHGVSLIISDMKREQPSPESPLSSVQTQSSSSFG
jgi:hypothetical protein